MSSFNIVSPALLLGAGPFAVGKTSVTNQLIVFLKEFGFKKNVTVTTREPRRGEVEGIDYFFKTPSEFQDLVDSDAFIEHAMVHDNRYGSLKKTVFDAIEQGDRLILTLDVQGHRSLRRLDDERINYSLFSFFLTAPFETLVSRALSRPGGMSNDEIERRLESAKQECASAPRDNFDLILTNGNGEFEANVRKIGHWVLRRIKERDNDR